MTAAVSGYGNTSHSAAQPLRLRFDLPVAITQVSYEREIQARIAARAATVMHHWVPRLGTADIAGNLCAVSLDEDTDEYEYSINNAVKGRSATLQLAQAECEAAATKERISK